MSKNFKTFGRTALILGVLNVWASTSFCWAHGDEGVENAASEDPTDETHPPTGHHLMTHPFLVHMGLPDGPGEASVRVTQIERSGALGKGSDQAFHIEAGLAPRLGVHLRNDAIGGNALGSAEGMAEEHGTELMVMYSVIQNSEGTRGISVFGETAWPTNKGDGPSIRGAAGIGGSYLFGDRILLDSIVHADPSTGNLEFEYENSLRVRCVNRSFLVVEDKGSLGGHSMRDHYILTAAKVELPKTHATVGIGLQIPTSRNRDFNRQSLFQLEIGF